MSIKKGLSSSTLKIIALILMTIDHIGIFIPNTPFFFRMVGRLSAPLFFFTLAFSFQNTSSRKRFLLRLYVSSVVMELIKIIISFFDTKSITVIESNVFSTMFLAVGIALCLESIVIYYRSSRYAVMLCYITSVVVIVIWSFVNLNLSDLFLWFIKAFAPNLNQTEGGFAWVFLGVGMCLFAKNKRYVIYFFLAFCALEFLGTILFAHIDTLLYNIQWMMVFALPFFILYNNQRGKSSKWFFYIYYPLHICALYFIGRVI